MHIAKIKDGHFGEKFDEELRLLLKLMMNVNLLMMTIFLASNAAFAAPTVNPSELSETLMAIQAARPLGLEDQASPLGLEDQASPLGPEDQVLATMQDYMYILMTLPTPDYEYYRGISGTFEVLNGFIGLVEKKSFKDVVNIMALQDSRVFLENLLANIDEQHLSIYLEEHGTGPKSPETLREDLLRLQGQLEAFENELSFRGEKATIAYEIILHIFQEYKRLLDLSNFPVELSDIEAGTHPRKPNENDNEAEKVIQSLKHYLAVLENARKNYVPCEKNEKPGERYKRFGNLFVSFSDIHKKNEEYHPANMEGVELQELVEFLENHDNKIFLTHLLHAMTGSVAEHARQEPMKSELQGLKDKFAKKLASVRIEGDTISNGKKTILGIYDEYNNILDKVFKREIPESDYVD